MTNRTIELPLLATDLERVRQPLSSAWTLPPAAYTDPAVYAAERERIFARDWICVARAEQLPNPGDYVCVDLPTQPIVVVRGMDGELQAMSRVCLHRAMPVAEGSGNTRRFVCPYHHWTYELDGRLRSAPMMDGLEDFATGSCRLPQLQLALWQGFVMVNVDPDAPALAPQLTGLDALIQNYGLGKLVVTTTLEFDSPWNWKILVENFMEAYHHIGPHRNTFEPVYPARDSYVEDNDEAPWSLLRMPGHESPAGAEGGLPPLPGLEPQQHHELLAGVVYPNLLFALSGELGVWYQLMPSAHDQMQLKIHALLPEEVAAALDDDGRTGIAESLRLVHLEDIEVNAGPWRGLQGTLTRQGRLSRYEKAIWQLNQLWLTHLGVA
jgi:phenylpropionate dioxygenase-like ring-hydroxylating dioxygenase large terminal subunit